MSRSSNTPSELGLPSAFTRRDALRAGGMSVAALMTPALLSACGSSGSGSSVPSITGRVTSGMALAPTTFDPHTASTIGAWSAFGYLYEGLYGTSPDAPYALEPQLASGEPEQVTPTRARIQIRSGAQFHNGTPVTANDVEASFKRILDPKTVSFIAGWLTMIKEVKAVGPDTVEVVLNAPTTLLTRRLAVVKIIPVSLASSKGGAKVFDSAPIGSGPYAAASIASNLRTIQLDRFREYNGAHKPALAKIGLTVITEDQARVAALQTKRLQAMTDPPFSAIERLGNDSRLDAGGTLAFQQSLVIFNNKKKPFDDKRIRQAILLAIDRDVITKSVFFGQAEAATSYLPANNPEYKQPTNSLAYDPDRARALLADAGASNLKLQLNVSNLGWLAPQAPLIQSQLKEVGIDAKIRLGETESLVQYVADGSFDVWLTVTDPSVVGANDGQFLIQWVYGTLAGFMYWTAPAAKQMASLLDRTVKASSVDEQKLLVDEMQDLIAEEVPAFPLHHRFATAAWSRGLDLEPDPLLGVNLLQAKLAA